ncbi:MAG TPA: FtsQ-type POTRA domain-containing protein [Thermoanaerobaculia bacterium]|nr:FtsQ-type POTRA domain-containing protein [Thermoanaerobaculia bacterium]
MDTTQRFLRPIDLDRTRRNHRRVQGQKAALIAANCLLVALLIGGIAWVFRRTQQDARFAVKQVRILGASHTSPSALRAIGDAYVGQNLFRIDLEHLRNQIRSLPWIEKVEIEKRLPDGLVVQVVERVPVALAESKGSLHYVDRTGRIFSELSPAVGNPELPLITGSSPEDVRNCVALLMELRSSNQELYASISELRAVPPNHFAIFDRRLGTVVYAERASLERRWMALYQIVSSEHLGDSALEYADLRFNDRIVVKPRRPKAFEAIHNSSSLPNAITN